MSVAARVVPPIVVPHRAEPHAPVAAAPEPVDPTWLQPMSERTRAPAGAAHTPAAAMKPAVDTQASTAAAQAAAIVAELRQVRGLIEDRFGALAYLDKLQRHPAHARLTQKLLDCGFSAALIRKLADNMSPAVADETQWVEGVLERNLATGDGEPALEDQGGVYALIGATGVGKTTSTAKLAAAFAAKHGAANLGLITLDAYRIGAHEQLRAYGRILGVPVHTAHDQASLEDLLALLAGKKMVLIDTAGMAQRDARTTELLDMLEHPSIQKLLVLNCASQGETLEDVIESYRGERLRGVVLSKLDEAVKLAPALDAVIRHRLCVLGVANGQRVPEDWHRLPASVLVSRALRATAWSAYRVEPADLPLVFTAPARLAAASAMVAHA
jgi:flagellar biosynthesis protein FlhF